jgi:hypothetical protein
MFSVQHSPGVQLRAAAAAAAPAESRRSPRRRAGSLKDALSFFWKHDINLTRLESRPRCGAAQRRGGLRVARLLTPWAPQRALARLRLLRVL